MEHLFEFDASKMASSASPVTGPVSEESSAAQTVAPKQRGASCAPCRPRRVKCERLPGPLDGCVKCVAKGIRCIAMPPTKRTLNRSGPRLELARAIYGQTTPIGPSAVTQRLATAEVKDSLMSVLLEEWISHIPYYQRKTRLIYKAFMMADHRIDQISASHKALCYAAMALMARTTDHPLVIGEGAPTAQMLAEGRDFGDLSEFGHRRETACAALLSKATEAMDTAGSFRHASPENITSLMLIEILAAPHVTSKGISAGRAFTSSYVNHTKELIESQGEDGVPDLNASLGWTAFFRDALLATLTGRSLSFTPDDALLLRFGHSRNRFLSMAEAISSPRLANPEDSFWIIFDSFLHAILDIFTKMSTSLTGYAARHKKELDDIAIISMLDSLDLTAIAVHELVARLEIFRLKPDAPWEHAERHLRDMRATRCLQCFAVLDALQKRLDEWTCAESNPTAIVELFNDSPGFTEPSSSSSGRQDGAALAHGIKLVTLHSHSKSTAFSAALEMVNLLEDMSGPRVTGGPRWLDPRGQNLVFAKLPQWAGIIVETITAEEGGPLHFTFAEKSRCLTMIRTALHSIGWSSPQLATPASWIADELAKLEARRQIFEFAQQYNGSSSFPLSEDPTVTTTWPTQGYVEPELFSVQSLAENNEVWLSRMW